MEFMGERVMGMKVEEMMLEDLKEEQEGEL